MIAAMPASKAQELPSGAMVAFALFMAWIGWYTFRVWQRYGRLPYDQRLAHRAQFKSLLFVRYPALYLVGTAGSIVAIGYSIWVIAHR